MDIIDRLIGQSEAVDSLNVASTQARPDGSSVDERADALGSIREVSFKADSEMG
jgi:hypothetical protein